MDLLVNIVWAVLSITVVAVLAVSALIAHRRRP